jgi:hypothetical protein
VAAARLLAMRVHGLLRGLRVRMRASHGAHGRFRVGGRNETTARVHYQAYGDQYGQEGAHCCDADLSRNELMQKSVEPVKTNMQSIRRRRLCQAFLGRLRGACLQNREGVSRRQRQKYRLEAKLKVREIRSRRR